MKKIEILKQVHLATLGNPKFDDQEKGAIRNQHSIWLTQLFTVCRDSKACLLQAIQARSNFLIWAQQVQGVKDEALINPEQIATLRKSTVVAITNEYGGGSGVVVGKHAVLTNCHVADDTKGTIITDSKGRTHAPTRVRGHGLFDFCLFTVPTLEVETFAPLAPFAAFNTGADIYTIGNPSGQSRTFSRGVVSSVRARNAKFHEVRSAGAVRMISTQVDAVAEPGSSGGALLDKNGRLVGIITYKGGERLGFAVPIQFLAYLPKSGVIDMASFFE